MRPCAASATPVYLGGYADAARRIYAQTHQAARAPRSNAQTTSARGRARARCVARCDTSNDFAGQALAPSPPNLHFQLNNSVGTD